MNSSILLLITQTFLMYSVFVNIIYFTKEFKISLKIWLRKLPAPGGMPSKCSDIFIRTLVAGPILLVLYTSVHIPA